jgi:hypothetical protein
MDGISMKQKMRQLCFAALEAGMETSFLSFSCTYSGSGTALTSPSG